MILASLLFYLSLHLADKPILIGPVEIHTAIGDGMFPSSWQGGDVSAKATPIAATEIERSLRLVKHALAKYPTSLLKSDLKKIYLVREMFFYGLPYGGTNSLDTLYICNEGIRKGFTDSYVEGSVYHEFSSILLRNYESLWKQADWTAANPKGFQYLGNGTDAVRVGATSLNRDPKLYPLGFLTTYSKASVEEDFNVMSESLFMGGDGFWKAVDKYEPLRRKCKAAVAFYGKIAPQFTESWFRKQASGRPASRG
ncbi:MAG: hypothetical protein ACAH95_14965 [Fimbriimonas sp.]